MALSHGPIRQEKANCSDKHGRKITVRKDYFRRERQLWERQSAYPSLAPEQKIAIGRFVAKVWTVKKKGSSWTSLPACGRSQGSSLTDSDMYMYVFLSCSDTSEYDSWIKMAIEDCFLLTIERLNLQIRWSSGQRSILLPIFCMYFRHDTKCFFSCFPNKAGLIYLLQQCCDLINFIWQQRIEFSPSQSDMFGLYRLLPV